MVDAGRKEVWQQRRKEFELLKETPEFKQWKGEQFYCQDGKCAWCQKPIDIHKPDTHVDHIRPLFSFGSNYPQNLVLSCAECNMKKGSDTRGYQ